DAVVLPNPYVDAPTGAGIQAAQLVAERSPRAAFAGSFGPNATGVLSQAGIAVVPVSGMPVREAVEAYLAGRLSPAAGLASRSGFGPGMGPGMGRGMGQRMGRGMRVPAPMGWPPQARPGPAQPEDPRSLVEKVDRLESELAEIKRKLCELKGGG
ncbi:NifB/NifX family molybdenum-iron cluster-binding protein, partial [Candidatus Bipolaricaulota bacterium]|nr:NifB/NifX family molybdenum-iron cluster-binding protein [Candidatus Bipolaricaulota bacterium]